MITPEVLELFVELEKTNYDIHKSRLLALKLGLFSEWYRSCVLPACPVAGNCLEIWP